MKVLLLNVFIIVVIFNNVESNNYLFDYSFKEFEIQFTVKNPCKYNALFQNVYNES